jgi:putative transcriptional regulator
MGERKLKVVDVARLTELHRNTITLLYNETAARVDLDAIDKLCRLFDATVGNSLRFCQMPRKRSEADGRNLCRQCRRLKLTGTNWAQVRHSAFAASDTCKEK